MSRSICPECDDQTFWDGFGECDSCGYGKTDNLVEELKDIEALQSKLATAEHQLMQYANVCLQMDRKLDIAVEALKLCSMESHWAREALAAIGGEEGKIFVSP